MQIVKKVTSKTDGTVKFIFELEDGLFSEVSAIVRKEDRLAICVSTQTWCAMGCKFCHITNSSKKQKLRNLTYYEMYSMAYTAIVDMPKDIQARDMLLIAYMGIGEPLENIDNVIESSRLICDTLEYNKYRFSIATMVPEMRLMELIKFAKELGPQGKVHYSLHSTEPDVRRVLMPKALDSKTVIPVLKYIKGYYKTPVEIHYALIDGFNDSWLDINSLARVENGDIPVTFLNFAECGGMHKTGEAQLEEVIKPIVREKGVDFECYTPPGEDIGAGCGQILIGDFLE